MNRALFGFALVAALVYFIATGASLDAKQAAVGHAMDAAMGLD